MEEEAGPLVGPSSGHGSFAQNLPVGMSCHDATEMCFFDSLFSPNWWWTGSHQVGSLMSQVTEVLGVSVSSFKTAVS